MGHWQWLSVTGRKGTQYLYLQLLRSSVPTLQISFEKSAGTVSGTQREWWAASLCFLLQ